MAKRYRGFFSKCMALLLGLLILHQGYGHPSYVAKHSTGIEALADVLFGWEHDGNIPGPVTDKCPEPGGEHEEETAESDDSKLYESFKYILHPIPCFAESKACYKLPALNSGTGKIPTPPPET